ncbi:MAG: hypothetical protein Q7R52_03025 [archaeon]|nr:hypothetical protein [archaeon]
MSHLKCWRKTRYGRNWAKGTKIILNISNKYKVNTLDGYSVNIYDLTKQSHLNYPTKILKTFKNSSEATKFAKSYMKNNNRC